MLSTTAKQDAFKISLQYLYAEKEKRNAETPRKVWVSVWHKGQEEKALPLV